MKTTFNNLCVSQNSYLEAVEKSQRPEYIIPRP
jgi:hypothetical protein